MKLKLRLNGLEPELTIIRKNKTGGTNTLTVSLFYPIRYLKSILYDINTKRYLSKLCYPIIKCEGCGMGWAEWQIINPNYGEKDTWKVCNHCVDFYDMKWSKVRLEILWRNEDDKIFYRNR